MTKGILSGLACGAVVALVLHGFIIALEYPLERHGVFLRQTFAAFPLEPWLRLQAPMTVDRLLSGACWGAVLGLVIYGGRMPHRLTGCLFAAVVITALGYSVIVDGTYGSYWRVGSVLSGSMGSQILVNGLWGWLTGVMMLFSDALRMSLRNDLAGPARY
jgi:hypothetical protein